MRDVRHAARRLAIATLVALVASGGAAAAADQVGAAKTFATPKDAVESLLGDRTERVGPGSVIFQASNQLHTIRNVGTTPATYHVLQWKSPGTMKKP